MIAKPEWLMEEDAMVDYVKICRCGQGYVPLANEQQCPSCECASAMRDLAEERALKRDVARVITVTVGFLVGLALWWLFKS